jgi:hypothetical protein
MAESVSFDKRTTSSTRVSAIAGKVAKANSNAKLSLRINRFPHHLPRRTIVKWFGLAIINTGFVSANIWTTDVPAGSNQRMGRGRPATAGRDPVHTRALVLNGFTKAGVRSVSI